MKFAYADPPYYGQGKKHYAKHHALAAECDDLDWHEALIYRLMREYRDGWALSCTSGNLHYLLSFCDKDCRIMAWVKPFAVFKPNVNPAYAWEPVIIWGGRKRGRDIPTVRDWCSANITLKKGLTGAKPVAFCNWILECLNVQPGDTVDDLFPGTGVMQKSFEQFISPKNVQHPLELQNQSIRGGQ